MNKLLLIGSSGVGKSTIISRLINSDYPHEHTPTQGVEIHNYTISNHTYQLWDIGGHLLQSYRSVHDYIFDNTIGVMVVVDSGGDHPIASTEPWVRLLRRYVDEAIPVIVLAHKADVIPLCVEYEELDDFVRGHSLTDWYWTVGHEQFGDYDHSRGAQNKQCPVRDVVHRLVRHINNMEPLHIRREKNSITEAAYGPCIIESPPPVECDTRSLGGWEYYGGVMTRERAEYLVRGGASDSTDTSENQEVINNKEGTFLVRRSEMNFQLRVSILNDDGGVTHVAVKSEVSNCDNGSKELKFRVGRAELREIEYSSISDALLGLGLNLSLGLQFKRTVKDGRVQYINYT